MLEVIELMDRLAVPALEMVNDCVVEVPTLTVAKAREDGNREIVGVPDARPVPDRETLEGLPAALCVRDNVPDFGPVEVGAKVTVTVPVVPAARERLPGEERLNEPLSELMLLTDSVALPVLVTPRFSCPADPTAMPPNDSEVEVRERTGPVPVPFRETVAGLPAALLGRVRLVFWEPVAVGVKVTVTLPDAPVARVRVVGDTANMALPEVMVPTDSVPAPVLVIVKDCWAEDPVVTTPKNREAGEREMPATVLVPNRETEEGLPEALCEIDRVPA